MPTPNEQILTDEQIAEIEARAAFGDDDPVGLDHWLDHARSDIRALCATVKHLRMMINVSESWRGETLKERNALQSQLEQLRVENETLRLRVLELETELDTSRGYM